MKRPAEAGHFHASPHGPSICGFPHYLQFKTDPVPGQEKKASNNSSARHLTGRRAWRNYPVPLAMDIRRLPEALYEHAEQLGLPRGQRATLSAIGGPAILGSKKLLSSAPSAVRASYLLQPMISRAACGTFRRP